MRNKKGFTLVELLAVIVILAILATAAFTLVLPQIEKSRKKSFVSEVASIIDSAELYFLEHPTELSVKIEDLKPYIKNYDSSKVGCVMAPLDEGDNYTIRFSNGDYKTDGTTLYEIGDLKAASGAATDKVVKIDGDHPNFNDGCTLTTNVINQSSMRSEITNASQRCMDEMDFPQHVPHNYSCKEIKDLAKYGWLDRGVYTYYRQNHFSCVIYNYGNMNRGRAVLEC